ncbi:MAG: corrinoid protein [Dehalococcoidales bacterium]|nr:corrinoid protein [Dehalococcoidales bacterium]
MEIFEQISNAVIEGEFGEITDLVQSALDQGIGANEVIREGLSKGMTEVGRRFREGEYFMPEVLVSAKTMNTALSILKPLLVGDTTQENVGTFLIGTVKGDVHDIGKNMVSMMMEGAGFRVIDIGVDVKPEVFVKEITEKQPDVVGLSALLSTTMISQKETIEALKEAGVRDRVIVLVGGAPVDQDWANTIGADGYAPNASVAVEKAKELLQRRPHSYLDLDEGRDT